MLVYNKYVDRYATLISREGDHCTVRYEGDEQLYSVPNWELEDLEVKRPLASSVVRPVRRANGSTAASRRRSNG
jgi:hypothetical protein